MELGRQGGRAKTPQKTNAARKNGRKGGRPPATRGSKGADSTPQSAGRRSADSQGATTRPLTDHQAGPKRLTRRLVSVLRRFAQTPPRLNGALANVDDQLRTAVAALNRNDINYWEFRDATGRVEAHSYYQYPAMMVPSMQRILLQSVLRLQPGIRALVDPFAGSGTLMVEGMCAGLNVTAYDVNPLAVLLCRAKSEVFNAATLRDNATRLLALVAKDKDQSPAVSFTNGLKWFSETAITELSRLRRGILSLPDAPTRRFFWVALAETVRLSSNSRTSTYKLHVRTPEQIARLVSPHVTFERVVQRNLDAHEDFCSSLSTRGRLSRRRRYQGRLTVELHDSRLPDTRQHDILISSPPYGDNTTTVPYGQNAYLPLQWTDLDDIEESLSNSDCLRTTREIDHRSLGGYRRRGVLTQVYAHVLEHSPTLRTTLQELSSKPRDRAARVLSFVNDLNTALEAAAASIRANGYLIWTLGNRRVGNLEIPLHQILKELLLGHDCSFVASIARQIPTKRMASRNCVSDTIKQERVMIFRKNRPACGPVTPVS